MVKIYETRVKPTMALCECTHTKVQHQSAFTAELAGLKENECTICKCPKFDNMELEPID